MTPIQKLKQDKILARIIDPKIEVVLEKQSNLLLWLCRSIISQQLSTKVAAVLKDRFLLLLNDDNPTPQKIISLSIEQLKSIGLSNSKANYIQNVGRFFLENDVSDSILYSMENEALIALLIQIKGIGRWTCEMLLMFGMGREDVFAVDDLGIQQQMSKLYAIDHLGLKERKKRMMEIAENWRPYRTYACWYLWRSKDSK